jgi:hypothetical protein
MRHYNMLPIPSLYAHLRISSSVNPHFNPMPAGVGLFIVWLHTLYSVMRIH